MPSQVVGSIVGTFKVGDGHKVGPPLFQPAKPQLKLSGKHFNLNVLADLKQVTPRKAQMKLSGPQAIVGYYINASSTVAPSGSSSPLLILRGKAGLRLVTPQRQITGKAQLTLRSKSFRLNKSYTPQPGKAKLILRGKGIKKVGKAGLVPTIPIGRILAPSPAQDHGDLVPTAAYTELLVPTAVRNL